MKTAYVIHLVDYITGIPSPIYDDQDNLNIKLFDTEASAAIHMESVVLPFNYGYKINTVIQCDECDRYSPPTSIYDMNHKQLCENCYYD